MPNKAIVEKPFRLHWFVVLLLILGVILGGGAVFQKLMLTRDSETYPAPGFVLDNISPLIETVDDTQTPDELLAEVIGDLDGQSPEPLPEEESSPEPEPSASPTPPANSGVSIHAFITGARARETQAAVLLLGGWGTASPVLDYEPLIAQLKDSARVIAVERPGYGWSGSKYSERTLDNMLGETRAVLSELQETGPYIIVAHTTAGLEAIHYAVKYPSEVAGIVFINAMSPAAYSYNASGLLDFLKSYSFQVPKYTGIFRAIGMFMPGLLTPSPNVDAASYAAMYCKNIMSPAMRDEAAMLSKNAKTALLDGIPLVPVTAFVDTKSYNANPELSRVWSEFNAYVNANVIETDVGSYIHGADTATVASEVLRLAG